MKKVMVVLEYTADSDDPMLSKQPTTAALEMMQSASTSIHKVCYQSLHYV